MPPRPSRTSSSSTSPRSAEAAALEDAPPAPDASSSGLVTGALGGFRDRLRAPEQRLLRFGTVLVLLAVGSALYFELTAQLTPLDALSYAITLLTGASLPTDIDAATAPDSLRIYAIFLSLVGAALVAIVYAFITDALIRSRLLQTLGRRTVPGNIRDHVVVAGLGAIGYRVALGVQARGVPVVVVESQDDGRFVSAARAAGIPVVIGDARHREVLEDIRLERARALVCATSDDLVNLSTALNGRTPAPGSAGRRPAVRSGVRPARPARLRYPLHALRVRGGGTGLRRRRDPDRGGRHGPGRRSPAGPVRPTAHPRGLGPGGRAGRLAGPSRGAARAGRGRSRHRGRPLGRARRRDPGRRRGGRGGRHPGRPGRSAAPGLGPGRDAPVARRPARAGRAARTCRSIRARRSRPCCTAWSGSSARCRRRSGPDGRRPRHPPASRQSSMDGAD